MHLNAHVRYHASDMILIIDSNTACLVSPNARNRITGYFQLNNNSQRIMHPDANGVTLIDYKTLEYVASSAAEVETARVFHNKQVAILTRHTL